MRKMKRKLISIFMAGIIALSCSLSAVAEETFIDEAVTGEEIVTVEDGLDIDHVCTDDHDHGYDEVTDIYASIMASAGCPHSMVNIPGGQTLPSSSPCSGASGCSIVSMHYYPLLGCTYCGHTAYGSGQFQYSYHVVNH